jgi:hypothetical protein
MGFESVGGALVIFFVEIQLTPVVDGKFLPKFYKLELPIFSILSPEDKYLGRSQFLEGLLQLLIEILFKRLSELHWRVSHLMTFGICLHQPQKLAAHIID